MADCPDFPRRAALRGVAAGAALLLAASLGACNVRPMYGELSTGATVMDDLKAIDIEQADDRIEQKVRNELIFAFTGGGYASDPRYRLRIILTRLEGDLGVEEFNDVPAAYMMHVSANFYLLDKETGRQLMTGKSFANTSYDFSTQRFANVRAKRDAEDRAAKVIADDIRTRIASYFAQRKG